jgi:hypothetical protein
MRLMKLQLFFSLRLLKLQAGKAGINPAGLA